MARMISLPVASPRAWAIAVWLCPPSRPSSSLAIGFAVEDGSPFDQLPNLVGGFADDHLDDFRVAQVRPGNERVGDVVFEAIVRGEHPGDATLGIAAIGFLEPILGDHQRRKLRVDRHRRPQAGDPSADDQHVDKVVRNPLGMERHQVARNYGFHAPIVLDPR